jgi:hypothetical protein
VLRISFSVTNVLGEYNFISQMLEGVINKKTKLGLNIINNKMKNKKNITLSEKFQILIDIKT